MEKYVRVDWPESQEWVDVEGTIVAWDEDYTYVFVPEELYNRVTEREEPTVPDENDPIWDEYVGMPEESKPWFMKNN